MPKARQTCTRCSQRRQKCDRKQPCSRCVSKNEGHICTTVWSEGYNATVHRRYPSKPSASKGAALSADEETSNLSPRAARGARTTNSTSGGTSPTLNILDGPERFSIGESRVVDISVGALLNDKDTPSSDSTLIDQGFKYVSTAGKFREEPRRLTTFLSLAAQEAEVRHIRGLLPTKHMLLTIVDYYGEHMLYWAGGIYHGLSFRKQLLDYLGDSSTIDPDTVDLRWMGLLFAILSSSLIGCPESLSMSWGYAVDDKVQCAREWGAAAVTCLNLGNYTSQYHVCSIHAIFILHSFEHLIGSTNQWTAMRSVAVVIARGLGLHRLSEHPDDSKAPQLRGQAKQDFIDREIGRRTWGILVSQEWLCAASQSSYIVTIQKRHFTSARPRHLNEQTMLPVARDEPSLTLVGDYFFEYGSILLDFHNAITEAVALDEVGRYAVVLKFDGDLRATTAAIVPKFLSPKTPLETAWPSWVKWARTLHQASTEHKIIMLHQSFLSKSFRDPRYTYTRWACASAAKKIINLYGPRDSNEPQWWVEQAFVVTSAVCLLLDMFHRSATDEEVLEYHNCVQKAIRWLQQFCTSSVAAHGFRLLTSLLQEYNKVHGEVIPSRAAASVSLDVVVEGAASQDAQDLGMQDLGPALSLPSDEMGYVNFNFDIDNLAFEDLMDYLPTDGVDSNNFCDEIFGLANGSMWS